MTGRIGNRGANAFPVWMLIVGLFLCQAAARTGWGEPPKAAAEKDQVPAGFLEDVPAPFVPLHPRTVEQRKEIEAEKFFVQARALETDRQWSAAIDQFKHALQESPTSTPVLRRLIRLCFALNRNEEAIKYGVKAIEVDPADTSSLRQLVGHYRRSGESDAAVALFKKVLDDPKLAKRSTARIVIEHDLGLLYAGLPGKAQEAADCWTFVVDALEDKDPNTRSSAELREVLGDNPATSYLSFGRLLLTAKRYDAAVKAFRRGLVYDRESVALGIALSEALLGAGKAEEALGTVEAMIKRQPQGNEGYDLLARVLSALHREKEILPRLEAAAKADSKNLNLQYALAEAYRRDGQVEKADALIQAILQFAPNPQAFASLASSLLRDKKTEQLLKLLGQAMENENNVRAVQPTIDAIINDPAYAEQVMDVGVKLLSADPPALERRAQAVLVYLGRQTEKYAKLVELAKIARKKTPSPQTYLELAQVQMWAGQTADALATEEELLVKFPEQRNSQILRQIAYSRLTLEKYDGAIAAVREAMALEPNDPDLFRFACLIIGQAGRYDEAFEMVQKAKKNDPDDPDLNQLHGSLLAQAGRNDEAIALYLGLIERHPDDDELVKMARLGLSIAYVNKDEYTQGEKELEILLAKDPEDAGVNNDLGYLYADQGKNLEKAESMVRKALEQDKTNSAYLDSLGWVLFKRGKLKESLVPLEQAVKSRTGSDATVHDHLGEVYFELHEYDKAKATWEQAEKLGMKARPPDKRLPSIRRKLESLKKVKQGPKAATNESF